MKRLLLLALTAATVLTSTMANAQCCCSGMKDGSANAAAPQEGTKK